MEPDFVEVSVADNGVGISQDALDDLFKLNVPDLAKELSRPERWYPSMLDGDTCLEPAPERERGESSAEGDVDVGNRSNTGAY